MKNYIAFIALLIGITSALPAGAQSAFSLSGTLKDQKTGETLIGATLRVEELPASGAVTNEYGFYSLTLSKGRYTLLLSSVGYATVRQQISLNSNQTLDIALAPEFRK